MGYTWEEIGRRTDLGDACFSDDRHEFRGPLRKIVIEGETVTLYLSWVAFRRHREETWRPWGTTSTFYAMRYRTPELEPDGTLRFRYVVISGTLLLASAGRLARPVAESSYINA